eukprot:CAMPEP_0172627182 /NCGR_PEP_ID=MMETSP1068-20121228/154904_1 /TAXON_ID=35684 /ORGANISM="Pseudopedinella elastica, Strain CCMP716" /LENGTH=165 /DNA_ID=CAMNT_0013436997 /DNA_START=95 /DNA_END=589 /DNA_ORIENTATION=+
MKAVGKMRRIAPKKDTGPKAEEIKRLYDACGEGAYAEVKRSLSALPKFDLNTPHGHVSWTMLHFASYNGHTQIVKLLLIKGADAYVKDKNGWMPIDYASREHHGECVRLLQDPGQILEVLAKLERRQAAQERAVARAPTPPEEAKRKKAEAEAAMSPEELAAARA